MPTPAGGAQLPSSWSQQKRDQWMGYFNDASQKWGVPVQQLINQAFTESTFNPLLVQKGTGAQGVMQWVPGTRNDAINKWGFTPFNPMNPKEAIDATAHFMNLIGTGWFQGYGKPGTGLEALPYDPLRASFGYIYGQNAGFLPQISMSAMDANFPWEQFGPQTLGYVEKLSPGAYEVPAALRGMQFMHPKSPEEQSQEQALASLGWRFGEGIYASPEIFNSDGSFNADALRTIPGALPALAGAFYQSTGDLSGWGFDLASKTWQPTGGSGGYSLFTTSPDLIESGLMNQWLPGGYRSVGEDVWKGAPLNFWAPPEYNSIFGEGGFDTQAGGGGFDLFNPQGQFDVNMLNAPGAVSPGLGAMLQQQGIVNPSKGYNPVNQVWQDAPPAPNWMLTDLNQLTPGSQLVAQSTLSTLYPTMDFTDAFEGVGDPFSGPPVMNWLPPPTPPAGQQYNAPNPYVGMEGLSTSSIMAPSGPGYGAALNPLFGGMYYSQVPSAQDIAHQQFLASQQIQIPGGATIGGVPLAPGVIPAGTVIGGLTQFGTDIPLAVSPFG